VPALLAGLLSLLLNLIMQHFIIFQPLDEKNNILTSTIKSLRYFLPFLVIMVLFAFAGAIGMVLGILALVIGVFFVILYLFTLYLFFLPLLMIEGPHIGNTISRSFSLFHRNFWQNIGLTGIFLIIIIVLSVILSSIIMLPFAGSFMKNIFNPGETEATDFRLNPVFIVLSALAGAFTFPLMPILSCVLYFNGRAEEDQQVETAPAEYRPTIDDLYGRPRDRNTEENN
jgi:hypothetical protein